MLELTPVDATEVTPDAVTLDRLWLRDGFPESELADDDADSLASRRDFIRSCLEREVPIARTPRPIASAYPPHILRERLQLAGEEVAGALVGDGA